MRPSTIISTYLLVLAAAYIAGCADRTAWSCRRSSECPEGDFCRVGECVPAVGFIADAGAQGAHGAEAGAPGCPDGDPPREGDLALNEVLVNVPGGDEGDANGDGVRDAYDDEFVEIVNRTEHTLDITGVGVRNGSAEKFVFGPTCLAPQQAAIIFGGGQPAQRPEMLVRVASSRFAFGNGGGSIVLAGSGGEILGAINYDSAPAEALTLSPQLDGAQFVPHSTLSAERLTSPGTCAGGQSFADGCGAPEGE